MRLNIVLVCLVFAATSALAHPHGLPVPKPLPQNQNQSHVTLDLSNLHLHLFHEPSADGSDVSAAASPGAIWSQQKSASDIAIGTLHAHFGTDDNPRANLSTYEMQGADQLGSSMWHNEQGRSAKLLFVWPTEK